MNQKRTSLLSVLGSALAVAAWSVATAEDVSSSAAKDKDTIQVPEIIINGHKESLSQLQAEIYKAEDDFIEAFNQANTKPEYRTSCGFKLDTDTHIPTRVCRPEFVREATEADAQAYLGNLSVSHKPSLGGPGGQIIAGPLARPASMVISEKMPAYRKHMRDLVRRNPKLREALGQYYALRQHYDAVSKEKLKGRWFVWD